MPEKTSKILELDQSARMEIIDVLAASFFDYTVFRYILKDSGPDRYEEHLRALIGFYADARLMRGWPVYGVGVGVELAAAMLVSDPVFMPRPPELNEVYDRLSAEIGEAAVARGEAFESADYGYTVEMPTYFVGMIGVKPTYQRKGLGRRLMSHIKDVSEKRKESEGITLTTETETNVGFYKSLGFRVVGQAEIGNLTSWLLLMEH